LIYERVSGDQIRTSVTLAWDRSSKKLEITINDVVVMRRAVVLTNDLVVGIVNGIGKALARASSDTEALNQSLKDSARAIEKNLQADIGKLLKTPKMPPLLQFAELQWEVERRD
jgi:2,3-bisphosphoglycerate-independent phosphoglycerate mutase